MENTTQAFLSKLQELKEKTVKVDVVSQGKSVDAFPLSFKQQKLLISTIADGTISSLKFQKYINDIIIENVKHEQLYVVDKLPIVVALRIDSIGDILKTKNGEGSLNEVSVRLKSHSYDMSTVIKGDVTVNLKVPTIAYESVIIQGVIDILKKSGEKEIGKNIGSIYTYEIVKYIESVKFGEDELKFSDISIKDRANIIDNLPVSVNKDIIAFIQNIKKTESDELYITVEGEKLQFDVDVTFFDS